MSRYIIKAATEEHDSQLAEMSKVPMPGMISLALEKSPSYLNAIKLSSEKPMVLICINTNDNSLAATLNIGQRLRSANGEWVWQKYFSDLRIMPTYRGSRLLYYLLNYMAKNHLLEKKEQAETIIFADNKPMIRYALNSSARQIKISTIPIHHYAHEYVTYTIAAQNLKIRKNKIQLRRASVRDLKNLQDFYNQNALQQNGSHYIDWKALGSGHYASLKIEDFQIAFDREGIIGIMGAWDQTAIRRTRIVAYAPVLKLLRPLVNFLAPLSGSIPLPQAGNCIEVVSVVGMSILNDRPEIFEALLSAHLHHLKVQNSNRFLQIGLDMNSPFSKCIRRIRSKHTTVGKIFYVTARDEPSNTPAFSRLEVARI